MRVRARVPASSQQMCAAHSRLCTLSRLAWAGQCGEPSCRHRTLMTSQVGNPDRTQQATLTASVRPVAPGINSDALGCTAVLLVRAALLWGALLAV